MSAFAVKHIVTDQGPLLNNINEIRRTPCSYTSKDAESNEAAGGGDVYVIEVRLEGKIRTYWLGYKYKAHERFKPAGGGRWKGKFKYKNSSVPGERAVGFYFEELPRINDVEFCDWLRSQTFGMAQIPNQLIATLEALIANPENNPLRFD